MRPALAVRSNVATVATGGDTAATVAEMEFCSLTKSCESKRNTDNPPSKQTQGRQSLPLLDLTRGLLQDRGNNYSCYSSLFRLATQLCSQRLIDISFPHESDAQLCKGPHVSSPLHNILVLQRSSNNAVGTIAILNAL